IRDCFECFIFFFFFSSRRRHTRSYGDWSSDVCSSDLTTSLEIGLTLRPAESDVVHEHVEGGLQHPALPVSPPGEQPQSKPSVTRSEERRVGKECRSRGGAEQ